ncbi:DUF4199 domain-containing protein [Hymenobacter sp. 5317J-9]|uniref:DUF4199 domain-containing protein n=1 Tax=Hymenobacter sp. 5317J-9 TaxID=2932250 RepID=UPI001FD6FA31|nr:DUF4199 domain-containing protein [Hymenobacter sp. 5317J-9]UOQ99438.1 DUF4199 domain-containing protein [Hymenobacter sp. 5317J-9]
MAVSSSDSAPRYVPDSRRLVIGLALRFGIGVGLVCVLWMVGLQLAGNNGFGPKQLMAQLLVPMAAVASQWVLRRSVKPNKPGLGRSLGVGVLTVLLAAAVSAVGVLALAAGAGPTAVAQHRAEVKEIVQAQQRLADKGTVTATQRAQQLQKVEALTVGDMASSNFLQVLVLGLVLAVPAGIFLRE